MKISLVFMTLIVPVVLGDEAKPASLRGGYSGETPDPAARNVTSRALQSCTNYPNWYDTTGPTYTCNWYAQKGFCPYPGTTPSVGLMSVTEVSARFNILISRSMYSRVPQPFASKFFRLVVPVEADAQMGALPPPLLRMIPSRLPCCAKGTSSSLALTTST